MIKPAGGHPLPLYPLFGMLTHQVELEKMEDFTPTLEGHPFLRIGVV